MACRLHATGQSAAAAAAAAAVTLDGAYDEGGAGVGRTITVDTGAVELIVPSGSGNLALELDYRDTSGTILGFNVGAPTTLVGALLGVNINLVTNLTAGSQSVTGLHLQLPDNDQISSRGILIDTRMQQGIFIRGEYAGATTLSAATIGLDLNLGTNVTAGSEVVTGFRLIIPGSSSASCRALDLDYRATAGTVIAVDVGAATTLSAALTGINLDLNTNVTAGSNAVIGLNLIIPASSGANTRAIDIDFRATNGRMIEGTFGAATTLAGAHVGLLLDLATNVTAGSNAVTGAHLIIPGSSSADCRALDLDYRATAGSVISIDVGAATTLSAKLLGLEIDLATNVTAGSAEVSGLTLILPPTTGNHFTFDCEDQNAGAIGTYLRFFHNSATPTSQDRAFRLQVDGEDDGGARGELGSIQLNYLDPTAGAEAAAWEFYGAAAGAQNLAMILLGTGDLRVDIDSAAVGPGVVGLFDDFDDVAVVDSVLHDQARGLAKLEEMGIVTKSHAGNRMLSLKKAIGLAYGGIVQSHQRMLDLVQDLQSRLLVLEGGRV